MRDDYHTAQIVAIVNNMSNKNTINVEDALLKFETKSIDTRPSWQIQKEKLNAFAKTHPKQIIDNRKN